MPYAVRKRGKKFVTINKDTGEVKGTHDTEHDAVAQMRLLYHLEAGGKVTGKKKKFRIKRRKKES